MGMEKKDVRLYNLIFPLWLMVLFPPMWLIALPANFFIDLLVLRLTMKHLNVHDRKDMSKQVIVKSWLAGFASDFLGSILMFLWNLLAVGSADFVNAVNYNPFARLDAFLWVTVCVAVTGVVIYLFNKKLCLKNLPISDREKHKLALSMAVFTAPYLFYLPTAWFW